MSIYVFFCTLNATDYLSIVVDHVHPFTTTVFQLLTATSSIMVIMIMMMLHVTKQMSFKLVS